MAKWEVPVWVVVEAEDEDTAWLRINKKLSEFLTEEFLCGEPEPVKGDFDES